MSEPIKTAWCNILFQTNGGSLDVTGRPIFGQSVDARGLCNDPYDCYDCSHFQAWATAQHNAGWHVSFECMECINKSKPAPGETRALPGHYQSGGLKTAPNNWPTREGQFGPFLEDPDKESLTGCMVCGAFSILLQAVLRKGGK